MRFVFSSAMFISFKKRLLLIMIKLHMYQNLVFGTNSSETSTDYFIYCSQRVEKGHGMNRN